MHLSRTDIDNLDKLYRINLINSITGIKPANLIGTMSEVGETNLAVFSSVVHLGSNPPLVGFVLRPADEVARHTWDNIQATGQYTINHVHRSFSERAHYTSAKFEREVSEFEACHLTPEFVEGCTAPFVAESQIRFAMAFREAIPIRLNGTTLLIGEVSQLEVADDLLQDSGLCRLEASSSLGIGGLNVWYGLRELAEYPYARPEELPDFKLSKQKKRP